MSFGRKKNNKISDKIRKNGNQCFINRNYFEALSMYNEALRYAEANSKELGLCYGNRSAAFLKVKQYKACMENIQWARDNHFPEENLLKLIQREGECKTLMETVETKEETWNDFFKLSYQPNTNFPYLVDCLELKRHKRGKLLSTKRDLKAGDIIAITEPFYKMPIDTSSYRCNYCLSDKFMNFIPCTGCVDVMFCNETCMKKALNEFHQFECGIVDNPFLPRHCRMPLRMIMKCFSLVDGSSKKLKNILLSCSKRLNTPFDFQLNDPTSSISEKQLMLTQLCEHQQIGVDHDVREESFSKIQPFLKRHPKLKKIVTYELYEQMINFAQNGDLKLFKSIDGKMLSSVNEQSGPAKFTINFFGGAIDVCSNLFLYSCAPTVLLHPYNGKIVWIVLQPIKAGDWLTISFQNMFFSEKSRMDRRKAIPPIVCCCECPACVGNWNTVMTAAVTPVNVMRRSSEEAIAVYKEYCDEIANTPPSLGGKCNKELWFFISQFRWNLMAIGRATFWNKIPPFDVPNCANFGDIRRFLSQMGVADN